MASVRIVLRWSAGFSLDQASDEERERSNKAAMAMWEKWRADPGIKYICYYHQPQTHHTAVFELEDFDKLEQVDQDFNEARRAGWLLALHSTEIVRGRPDFDEWWAS